MYTYMYNIYIYIIYIYIYAYVHMYTYMYIYITCPSSVGGPLLNSANSSPSPPPARWRSPSRASWRRYSCPTARPPRTTSLSAR